MHVSVALPREKKFGFQCQAQSWQLPDAPRKFKLVSDMELLVQQPHRRRNVIVMTGGGHGYLENLPLDAFPD